MEGYIPRTDPMPRPPSAFCDTTGGCQRWNFDASPPLSDFVDYYMPPFKAAVQRAKVSSIMCRCVCVRAFITGPPRAC